MPGGPLRHLRAPHPVPRQRVHPWGCEEEGDDGVSTSECGSMHRGFAILQGHGERRHYVAVCYGRTGWGNRGVHKNCSKMSGHP